MALSFLFSPVWTEKDALVRIWSSGLDPQPLEKTCTFCDGHRYVARTAISIGRVDKAESCQSPDFIWDRKVPSRPNSNVESPQFITGVLNLYCRSK